MVAVFDVKTKSKVFCTKGDPAEILDCSFIDDTHLVTVGLKHYKH